MVYIKLTGHDFRYETEDIVKLFYNEDEICFVEDSPPEEYWETFLSSEVKRETNGFTTSTSFQANRAYFQSNIFTELPCSGDAAANSHERNRVLKREIRREIYKALAVCTQKKIPWGMLTGIRPAKIVHELLEEGRDEQNILSILQGYYMVSEPKARLLYNVAVTERRILNKTTPELISIYIGIPFCTTRCLYCSFISDTIGRCRHLAGNYMDALKAEIKNVSDIINERKYKIQSIYIGGGTPTSLDTPYLADLLDFIEGTFDFGYLEEYTLEAGRPDSMDGEKLERISKSRVDRISINPQTMNLDTLKLIGRNHTPEDIVNAFNLAREVGFGNINMDIIVGLPGEDTCMFMHTLEEIKKLDPENLTVHTLALKRASKLSAEKDKYTLVPAEEAAKMIGMAQEYAESMEMKPYYMYRQKNMLGNLENIGYCKRGHESIYNVQIMEERQTIIALGAGGITKRVFHEEDRIERAFNVKNVEEYISRVDEMIERKRKLLNM